MSVGIGRQNIIITVCFGINKAAQFHFWECINEIHADIYIGFSPLHLQCDQEPTTVPLTGSHQLITTKNLLRAALIVNLYVSLSIV
jgi:hypothetical protein